MPLRRQAHAELALLVLPWLLLGLGVPAGAQDRAPDAFDPGLKYDVEQVRQDFAVLRTALEEGHAGLTFYTGREEMTGLFDSLYARLDHPMTEAEFFRQVALLIADVQDGHTRVVLSEPMEEFLNGQPILMPFELRFIGGRAYLFRNYGPDPELPLGGEVIGINGSPVPVILEGMESTIPSDGRIRTSKLRYLENPVNFGRLFWLLFGAAEDFTLTCLAPESGNEIEVQAQGLTSAALMDVRKRRYPEAVESKPPMELAMQGEVAVLSIRTFSDSPYSSRGESYPLSLRKIFRELSEKSVRRLIIDLRDNGGGADLNGKLLVSYLLSEPYRFYDRLEMKSDSFSFLAFTNAPDLAANIKNRLRRNAKGTFDLLFHPNLGEQKPLAPTFSGKVFVLINGRSFSGSGECTSILHYHKRASFVGEECGAGYYGNTSGIMPLLKLPHTGLRVRLPMVRYHMAVAGYQPRDRGIVPDFPFERSIEDLLAGRDTELAYALELILRQQDPAAAGSVGFHDRGRTLARRKVRTP